jgi:methionine sulfoxide reductase catalytic subunit
MGWGVDADHHGAGQADARGQVGRLYSLGDGADKGVYYDAHPIEQMGYHLTMLAYEMNGEPLSFGHGAPLRLRKETLLGFKQVKWIKGVEFVADFPDIGGGYGGYN